VIEFHLKEVKNAASDSHSLEHAKEEGQKSEGNTRFQGSNLCSPSPAPLRAARAAVDHHLPARASLLRLCSQPPTKTLLFL
jgi:hypothetical protein